MTREEAIRKLSFHMMQCGAMMPIEWVMNNGEGSELMTAFRMALDALREQEELSKAEKNVTAKEKIADILNWVQTFGVHWNFMQCLKQELEELVEVAKLEVEG